MHPQLKYKSIAYGKKQLVGLRIAFAILCRLLILLMLIINGFTQRFLLSSLPFTLALVLAQAFMQAKCPIIDFY